MGVPNTFVDGTVAVASEINANFTYIIEADSWHEIGSGGEPAFENSWENYAIGYDTAAFYKDSMSFVHIKGMVKSGTVGAVAAFTLSAGYRPTNKKIFAVTSNGVFGSLEIQTGGEVYLNSGNNAYFSLEGISFKTN